MCLHSSVNYFCNYPNSQLTMNTATQRNNVKVIGAGEKTLLFVHGYGCSQNMWRFMTPNFEQDYKLVLIDLVGSGNSDESAYEKQKYSSLKGYAADVVELCQELGLEKVYYIGHSVSSMIGVHASLQAPELFEKLVMIGPSPRYINEGEYFGGFDKEDIEELLETLNSNYLGWSSGMAPAIMGNEERPELAEELENSFCQTNPEIAQHFAEVTFMGDDRQYLDQVTTPTLILQCQSDVIAPLEVGEFMANSIQNSTLKVLNATGHCPHMSAPEETSQAILQFLN